MKSLLNETQTQSVLDVITRFCDAWNKKDLDAFSGLFAEEAEFTDVVGQVALGREAIREQHVFPFQVIMKQATLELSELYLREIKPGLILVSGNWKVEGSITPKGDSLPARTGVIQIILEQMDTDWTILLVHNADHALPFERRDSFLSKGRPGS